jgi:hypothetical protein
LHPLKSIRPIYTTLFSHEVVRDDFGFSIVSPFLEDKTGNINAVENYHGITLITAIFEIFRNLI